MNKVSILMPVYNGAMYIGKAIESVLSQKYKDFELVVVNDGSTDETERIVASYQDAVNGMIRYIRQENQGLAAARNMGIRNSDGRYIALLDSDDIWLPQRLGDTVAVLDRMPKVGLVHGNISMINGRGEVLKTAQRKSERLSGRISEYITLSYAHIACPTVLFRRECIDKVGLFDENLSRLGCEDRDLWIRIASLYEVFFIDQVLALYRITEGSMSRNRARMLQARRYVIDKHLPADDPSQRRRVMRRLALSRVYRDRGDESLLSSDYPEARKEYLQSIRWSPISLWPWINYVKTFFPGLLHRKP